MPKAAGAMNLGRPDRTGRLDALAAEYALGTMSARARRRMARAARQDPTVASAIALWETRLASLAEAVPAVAPPPRVWEGIRMRLGFVPLSARAVRAAKGIAPWWASLRLWRAAAIASLAVTVGLATMLLAPRAERQEDTIVVVLAGPDGKPALVASADRNGRFLSIRPVAPIGIKAGRSLQLWGLPQVGDPRSIGLIPLTGLLRLTLNASADVALQNYPTLAVSLEPTGGSPTGQPTGPVVFTGSVERMY
jgi:anti-sigma-K factor RskA